MLRKLLFLLLPFTAFSQLSDIKNYYRDDGLYCKAVYNLEQDANGIIWIGTDNGLYSFDGKTFEPHDGSNQLKDTEILNNVSINDEIFITTLNKNYAYLKDGAFITKKENPDLGKIVFNNISDIIHDTISNKIAIFKNAFTKKLYTYQKGVVQKITFKDSVHVIHYRNDVVHFFNKKNELFQHDFKNNTRKKISTTVAPELDFNYVFFGKKIVAFMSKHKITFYKRQHDLSWIFLDSLQTATVNKRIYIHNDNEIWLTNHTGGITHYNITTKEKTTIFIDFVINNFFKDKDENVWFSTRDNGLFFWRKSKLLHFLRKNTTATEGKNILSVNGCKDSIYFGMNASKVGIIHDTLQREVTMKDDLELNGIISIYLSKNRFFFATTNSLFIYNKQFVFIDKISFAGAVKKVSNFDENYLIISISGSSVLLHKETLESKQIFTGRSYDAIVKDKEHAFICSGKGLFDVNIRTKEYKELIPEYLFFSGSKTANTCYAFATNAGGIFILQNDKKQQLTKKDGLLSNSITKVRFETPHILWAIGNRGVNRIVFDKNYNVETIDTFTEADGIPLATLNDFYVYNAVIYLATSKGLKVLNTQDLLHQKQLEKNTKLVLNHIQYQDSVFKTNTIQIPYTKNSITVNVSYPDYNSYGNTSLSYKLNNQEHYSVTKASDIILSSLQPGTHKLIIYGRNSSNILSRENLIISINVIPIFWQTWWFKMLVFALFIIVLYSVLIRIYINRKKRQQEKIETKKKLTELEVEVMKSQMNPHFIANCLNSIKLLNYKQDYANSQLYIDRFNRMLRFNLTYSNNTFVTIHDEVTYLNDYLELEKLRFKELFDYIITHDSTIEDLKIPSFLIQPFVENAIKHAFVETPAQKGNICIHFKVNEDKTTEITIQDDGIGIGNLSNVDQKKQSKGINLIRKRIELYREIFNVFITLSIVDLGKHNQKGTKVKLNINHTCNLKPE